MGEYSQQQWMKHMRRHEANVFNAFFYDREEVTDGDIDRLIGQVAMFFEMPVPAVGRQCETFAKIMTGERAEECELYYNLKLLQNSGINNRDAFTLCFVHELSHQLFYPVNFMLSDNERWIQELAADLMAGVYACLHHIATGKYKYVLSVQKACISHPNGKLRKEITDYGRLYFEKRQNPEVHVVTEALRILPAFVYMNYGQLHADWRQVREELVHPVCPSQPAVTRIEDLPDSNLLKQAVLKYRNQQNV